MRLKGRGLDLPLVLLPRVAHHPAVVTPAASVGGGVGLGVGIGAVATIAGVYTTTGLPVTVTELTEARLPPLAWKMRVRVRVRGCHPWPGR